MLDENERRMMEQHNRTLGFEGSPVCVVYGEGYASLLLLLFPLLSLTFSFPSPFSGFARLAIELLEKASQQNQQTGGIVSSLFGGSGDSKKHRIVLVATSTKWTAKDYGIDERNFLRCDEDNLGAKL
jgi:hypothetical protein